MRLPQTSEGYIDIDTIFTTCINRLKMSFHDYKEFLDGNSFTIYEFNLLVADYHEEKKEINEMRFQAVKVAHAAVMSGKDLQLYHKDTPSDESEPTDVPSKKVYSSAEERQKEVDKLVKMFD